MVGGFVPSTPVDHQHIALKAVPGSRAAGATCRASATRTTWSTARASTAGWCSAGTRRTRCRAGRTACRGSTPPRRCRADYERFAPLMAGAIRRFPFLADAEAIRLVCHPDAMTPGCEPAAGAAARGARVLDGGRPVAQRVRRGRRHRPGAGGLDHGRRPGRGHRAVSGVAVRRHLSRPGVRGGPCARDLHGLLPASLPVRCGRRRPAAPAVATPRPAAGDRRGVRDEGRLGAGRPPRAGPAMAARRSRPGRLRLDAAALVRPRRRGSHGGPRAVSASST